MWLEPVDNAEAVRSLYDLPPSLKGVWVSKIELEQDGPTLTLHIKIRELPNRPPIRWREPYNAVAFEMPSDLVIEGWDTENVVELLFRRSQTGLIETSIIGGRFRLSARCMGIRIQGFSPCLTDQQW